MKRAFVVASLALFVGCASASLTVTQPLGQPVREVSLKVAPAPAMTGAQQSSLRTLLTTALVESGVDVQLTAAGVSELNGEIRLYDPGVRALRYLIGFGAGRGEFESTWRVLDGAGHEVGSCRVDGSVTMGVFGGSYDDVLEEAGGRLGEFLTGRK